MERKTLIRDILYGYVKRESITCSKGEREAEEYFVDYFRTLDYFKEHPEYTGLYEIKDDPYGRAVSYAFVKGTCDRTIVLLHHNDVVTVEDFGIMKEYAFDPDALHNHFSMIENSVSAETKADFESGEWLFGRGVCDMKGGGAIEMALLSEYSKEELNGNVLVIGVPDEENLSAGMRAAIHLLKELKEKHGFDYILTVDTESHQRKDKDVPYIYLGSIGKVMPCVTVRGFLAHAGMMFEGFNPCSLMGEIVRNTEANISFSEETNGEVTPPPTWLYLRENKESYNVSMPLLVQGCLSVLTHNQSPAEIVEKLKTICTDSFREVIERNNRNYHQYLKMGRKEVKDLPWTVNVCEFKDLIREAENDNPDFVKAYEKEFTETEKKVISGEITYITATFHLTDFALQYIRDKGPRVVIGLVPPFYPNVSLNLFKNLSPEIRGIYDTVKSYALEKYGQRYDSEYYYTGISDLSYSSVADTAGMKECLEGNMPFVAGSYALPVDEMKEISMPGINLGPWGKDLHKSTERVLKEDLYERTPELLDHLIRELLK